MNNEAADPTPPVPNPHTPEVEPYTVHVAEHVWLTWEGSVVGPGTEIEVTADLLERFPFLGMSEREQIESRGQVMVAHGEAPPGLRERGLRETSLERPRIAPGPTDAWVYEAWARDDELRRKPQKIQQHSRTVWTGSPREP
jgi:hypothetical protein